MNLKHMFFIANEDEAREVAEKLWSETKIQPVHNIVEQIIGIKGLSSFHDEYKTLSPRKKKKFAEENAPPLKRFHSAGAALRSLYPDGKFPSVNALFKQRDDLEKEFKAIYQKYKELKKESADLDKATQTI